MVMGRTVAGQSLLERAVERQDVIIEPISYDEVLTSHRHLLAYKKTGVQVRRYLSRCKPVEGYDLPSLTLMDWLGSTLVFALLRFSASRFGRWAIGILPLKVTGLLSSKGREMFRSANQQYKRN
jgi:hypothetical protein